MPEGAGLKPALLKNGNTLIMWTPRRNTTHCRQQGQRLRCRPDFETIAGEAGLQPLGKEGSDRVIRVYSRTDLSKYNNSLLEFLTLLAYSIVMKATLTTKGQLTIPLKIRERLNLKAGDVLDFDENAPFLKAVRVILPEAWEEFGKTAVDPWGSMTMEEVMNELRGPVELPPSLKS